MSDPLPSSDEDTPGTDEPRPWTFRRVLLGPGLPVLALLVVLGLLQLRPGRSDVSPTDVLATPSELSPSAAAAIARADATLRPDGPATTTAPAPSGTPSDDTSEPPVPDPDEPARDAEPEIPPDDAGSEPTDPLRDFESAPGTDDDGVGPANEPTPPPPIPSEGTVDVPTATWVLRFAHDEPAPDDVPDEVEVTCRISSGAMTCDADPELDGAAGSGTIRRDGGELIFKQTPQDSWGRLELTANAVGVGADGSTACEMSGFHVHHRGAQTASDEWPTNATGTWLAFRRGSDC